ncbi:MAG TPA: glycosyltransferase [Candidatus Baltobacteraceae bacterium]|jgi:glycosyltransferase involved in cell wall biosynthesis
MLRVAFIDQTGAQAGGAQESFALLLAHLPSFIEPRVVVFQDGDYAARLRALGIDLTVFPVSESFRDSKREAAAIGGMLSMPAAIVRLASWLRRERMDAVYTHTIKAHFLGAPAARLAGKPCVMHLRDILEGRAKSALRLVALACAPERIAISKAVAQAYALRSTSVVVNPLDLRDYLQLPSRHAARELLGIPDDGLPVVGIVGRINRWKGHDRYLRIAAHVRERVDARFAIVGAPIFRDADFVAELEESCDSLGLRDRVTFVPWTRDMKAVYAALDVHCNCSTREPFGRTIVEAAVAGVPTVCFSDAGATDVLTDGRDACIVAAGDENAFAIALTGLLEDSRLMATVSEGARGLAAVFEPAGHALQVAEILRKAAA